MPFTLAHPVAAIPCRHLLGPASVLSALIIGSMVPDLIHFLPLGIRRPSSHSLAGLFWFCLPAGLLSYSVWHIGLRPIVTALLPLPVRQCLPRLPGVAWLPDAPLWAVVVSLTVGAATHLLWDACTHSDGFVVAVLPALRIVLWDIGGYRVFVYKLLQHGGSAFGLCMLAFWSWQWMRAASMARVLDDWQPPAVVRRAVCLGLLLVPLGGGVVAGLGHIRQATGVWALQRFMGYGVIMALTLLVVLLLVGGMLWRLWEAHEKSRQVAPTPERLTPTG